MKRVIELSVVGVFLFPLCVLLSHYSEIQIPDSHEVWPFLESALIQAVFSAFFGLAAGTLLMIGLLFIRHDRSRQLLQLFFLIPGLLPGIYIVLSLLHIYSYFDVHPMGYLGVVSANVVMSFGIVGYYLQRTFRNKVGGFAELARVEGASNLRILFSVLPLLRRDFLGIFLGIFIFAFLGFSIPLILGGLEAATLEVQIYRKVVSEGAIGEALAISIFQLVFIAICSIFVPLKGVPRKSRNVNLSFLGSPISLLVFVILTSTLLFAPLAPFFKGLETVMNNSYLRSLIYQAAFGTALVATTSGFVVLGLGCLVLRLWPTRFLSRFFYAYSAPSAVLIAFGFYLCGIYSERMAPQVIMLGGVLALFFWPSLYRIGFYSLAASLEGQIEIARQMGASGWQIFKEVTWPQMRAAVFSVAALTALWAAGDFGIASMLASDSAMLSLLVKGLISRYRLAEATFILWIMIGIAVCVSLIFLGLNRVGNRKSALRT